MSPNYFPPSSSSSSLRWSSVIKPVDYSSSHKEDRDQLSNEDIKIIHTYFSRKKSSLRQRVACTAIVYFKRFYLRASFCNHNPFKVAITCIYLASKIEEMSVKASVVVEKAMRVFACESAELSIQKWKTSDILACEFHLLENLNFDLIVFHPHANLESYMKSAHMAGYIQFAWSIANDVYCTKLVLEYPPFLISLACVFMTMVYHEGDLRDTNSDAQVHEWFSTINVNMTEILEITRKMQRFYEIAYHNGCEEIPSELMSRLMGICYPAQGHPSLVPKNKHSLQRT